MSVYFHASFGLNRTFMAGVLNSFLKSPTKSPKEIAQPFGYNAPFTLRYKSWLQKCGIVKLSSGKISLTPHGEIIWMKDPKLKSITTQWFMHWELSKSEENAEAWYFFIKEFLPKNDSFSKKDLENVLGMKLMPHSAQHFNKDSTMVKTISRKILDCYTQPEALGQLQIIKKESNNLYTKGQTEAIGPWKDAESFESSFE